MFVLNKPKDLNENQLFSVYRVESFHDAKEQVKYVQVSKLVENKLIINTGCYLSNNESLTETSVTFNSPSVSSEESHSFKSNGTQRDIGNHWKYLSHIVVLKTPASEMKRFMSCELKVQGNELQISVNFAETFSPFFDDQLQVNTQNRILFGESKQAYLKINAENLELFNINLHSSTMTKSFICNHKLQLEEGVKSLTIHPFFNHQKANTLHYKQTASKLFALNPNEEFSFIDFIHKLDESSQVSCEIYKKQKDEYLIYLIDETKYNISPVKIDTLVKENNLSTFFVIGEQKVICPEVTVNEAHEDILIEMKNLSDQLENESFMIQ